MATETVTETREVEEEVTYYLCDKCNGHFHDRTQFKNDLNKVIFGAEVRTFSTTLQTDNTTTTDSGFTESTSFDGPDVHGEHEYLLCDECMEDAHDYLSDFF